MTTTTASTSNPSTTTTASTSNQPISYFRANNAIKYMQLSEEVNDEQFKDFIIDLLNNDKSKSFISSLKKSIFYGILNDKNNWYESFLNDLQHLVIKNKNKKNNENKNEQKQNISNIDTKNIEISSISVNILSCVTHFLTFSEQISWMCTNRIAFRSIFIGTGFETHSFSAKSFEKLVLYAMVNIESNETKLNEKCMEKWNILHYVKNNLSISLPRLRFMQMEEHIQYDRVLYHQLELITSVATTQSCIKFKTKMGHNQDVLFQLLKAVQPTATTLHLYFVDSAPNFDFVETLLKRLDSWIHDTKNKLETLCLRTIDDNPDLETSVYGSNVIVDILCSNIYDIILDIDLLIIDYDDETLSDIVTFLSDKQIMKKKIVLSIRDENDDLHSLLAKSERDLTSMEKFMQKVHNVFKLKGAKRFSECFQELLRKRSNSHSVKQQMEKIMSVYDEVIINYIDKYGNISEWIMKSNIYVINKLVIKNVVVIVDRIQVVIRRHHIKKHIELLQRLRHYDDI